MAKSKVKKTAEKPPIETATEPPVEPDVQSQEEQPKRTVHCPVCDGGGGEYQKTGELTLCKCEDCGLVFQNPRPSLGYLALQRDNTFRNAMTEPHGSRIKEQSLAALEVMKGYHRHLSGRDAALNSFGKCVLDVNCGHGFRLREFQKYGWDICGIDTSKNAVGYAKACALDVKESWLDTAGFKPGTFDLVVFRDNFGELPDPKEVVKKLHELMKTSGLVYVHEKDFLEDDAQPGRLFYFDQDCMRRLFMENGCTVLEEEKDDTGFYFWFGKKG
jgi:SAM-dependent methyltransferase